MKKWLTIAVIAGLLTGCSNGIPEDDYFDLVRETPGLTPLSDESIRDIGGNICAAFETGNDYATVLAEMIDSGMAAGDSGALIAYSVSQYCPDELSNIPGG